MYSYKELRIATDGFSAANKIGKGGFGSVYKGKLKDAWHLGGYKGAFCKLKSGCTGFMTEITTISVIEEHDNLVKLYGCCVEGGAHRILVYGYPESNSLAPTLLEPRNQFES